MKVDSFKGAGGVSCFLVALDCAIACVLLPVGFWDFGDVSFQLLPATGSNIAHPPSTQSFMPWSHRDEFRTTPHPSAEHSGLEFKQGAAEALGNSVMP